MSPARVGGLPCGLPQNLPRVLKPTQAEALPGLLVALLCPLSQLGTWLFCKVRGRGLSSGLLSQWGGGPSRLFSSLCHTTPAAFCLQQDAFFSTDRYFWLSPRSSYNKREPVNLARSQPDLCWQVGLLWPCRKHLAQRPRHLPFSGPDGDPHFLSWRTS